jgi:hypothetical protein
MDSKYGLIVFNWNSRLAVSLATLFADRVFTQVESQTVTPAIIAARSVAPAVIVLAGKFARSTFITGDGECRYFAICGADPPAIAKR